MGIENSRIGHAIDSLRVRKWSVAALNIGVAAGLMTGLVACGGGLNQDPLSGQPEHIRNGVPPERDIKPKPAEPMRRDALYIDVDDFYDFRESEERSITFKGRANIPGAEFEMFVENSQDFQGARIEATNPKNPMAGLKFTWTPPFDYSAARYARELDLKLVLTTTNTPQKLSTVKTVKMFVMRQANAPEIVRVDSLKATAIREGESRRFQVTVRDIDGLATDEGRPTLVFLPVRYDLRDISTLVALDSKKPVEEDPRDPKQWIYNLVVNTEGKELTKGEEGFSFSIRAYSRFGAPSDAKKVEALVRTSVREPMISWKAPVSVVAGEDVIFSFHAYDPQFEGRVTLNFIDRPEIALGQAAWDCPPVSSLAEPVVCTIRWKVPADGLRVSYE
ncbi:MAG: hypothetical protein NDI61_13655, partial [Bdellovibrionaceae bacterium]|nr:hypothetical protein [Pseudobdellovibrionaceae bacterium]